MIRFLDLKALPPELRREMDQAYHRVMQSGSFVGGAEVAAFEHEFAAFCGRQHAIGVGNGLDALSVALMARGIGPGDVVLTAAHTFIATWLAIAKTGATIVPIDPDPETMNVSEAAYLAAVDDRTRAVVPVHLYGQPADLRRLRRLCDERGTFLLEDAAQAHGASVAGVTAGAMGHAAAFSFYPSKNLGALGDAGAIVTDDAVLANMCRAIANYGATRKYHHEVKGMNSRLDALQAAFLRCKLPILQQWNARRREIAAQYLRGLKDVAQIRLPGIAEASAPVWHLFVIRHADRDRLQAALARLGVETGIHYPIANHRSGAFKHAFPQISLPTTDEICSTCLSLPMGPMLEDAEVAQVIAAVQQAVAELDTEGR